MARFVADEVKIKLEVVDVQVDPWRAKRYNIFSIPTVVAVFKSGHVCNTYMGAGRSYIDFRQWVIDCMGREKDDE